MAGRGGIRRAHSEQRDEIEVDIDGVVIKVNDFEQQSALGFVSAHRGGQLRESFLHKRRLPRSWCGLPSGQDGRDYPVARLQPFSSGCDGQ